MLITRKIKQSFIWASLLVLASTTLIGLFPAQNVSAAPIEESRARRYVAGLVQCLMRIDDVYGEYMTESNLGDWLGYEHAVVGLDMETPNGVVTCGTALNESAKLLANIDSSSEAQVWLQNNIFPTTTDSTPTFNSFEGLRVSTSETEGPIQSFIDNTLIPYVNNIPVDARELAERMLILADFCYGYNDQDYSPSAFGNRAGTIFATEIDISQNEASNFVSIDRNNDGLTIGGLGGNNSYLADIELKFNMRTGGNSGPGGWDGPYVSNFLPIGADNMNLVNEFSTRDDGTGRGSIQDCNIVKDLEAQYGIFDFYLLNADSKLTFDGKTAQDILDSSTQDVDFNLANDAGPSCEGADALGWILCPIITGLLVANEWIFNTFILPFLTVDPINTNSGPVYAIWSSFRTIGNILLVFALLFIVFGQAIGGGLVDAYTAKKAMPRIFIAAILINISIYIVAFLVDMGNILGAGLGTMITAPLQEVGGNQYEVNGAVTSIVLIGLALSAGLAMVLFLFIKEANAKQRKELGTTALYIIGFMAIPAILVVLGIFFTLVIRLGAILLLAVISPVALAMFAMPSTDKYAKKWFDFLVKSILVYPIVIVLFAIAQVLSSLLSAGGNPLSAEALVVIVLGFVGGATIGSAGTRGVGGGIAGLILGGVAGLTASGLFTNFTIEDIMFSLVSIFVLFIPLALIPFSFKLAGGIMGSLLGVVTKGRSSADKLIRGDKHEPGGRYHSSLERLRHRKKETGIQLGVGLNKVFRGRYKEVGKPDIPNQKGSTGGVRGFSSANRRRGGGAHRVAVLPKTDTRVAPEVVTDRNDLDDGDGTATPTSASAPAPIPPAFKDVPGSNTGEAERASAADWARTQSPPTDTTGGGSGSAPRFIPSSDRSNTPSSSPSPAGSSPTAGNQDPVAWRPKINAPKPSDRPSRSQLPGTQIEPQPPNPFAEPVQGAGIPQPPDNDEPPSQP